MSLDGVDEQSCPLQVGRRLGNIIEFIGAAVQPAKGFGIDLLGRISWGRTRQATSSPCIRIKLPIILD